MSSAKPTKSFERPLATAEVKTSPPPSGYTLSEPKPRTRSQVMRVYKTPFAPFAVVKLRFWSARQVPRLRVQREELRDLGCTLEERLVACHIDGSASLEEIARECGMDHATLCALIGAMADRSLLSVE
jgi:hypothetical protein